MPAIPVLAREQNPAFASLRNFHRGAVDVIRENGPEALLGWMRRRGTWFTMFGGIDYRQHPQLIPGTPCWDAPEATQHDFAAVNGFREIFDPLPTLCVSLEGHFLTTFATDREERFTVAGVSELTPGGKTLLKAVRPASWHDAAPGTGGRRWVQEYCENKKSLQDPERLRSFEPLDDFQAHADRQLLETVFDHNRWAPSLPFRLGIVGGTGDLLNEQFGPIFYPDGHKPRTAQLESFADGLLRLADNERAPEERVDVIIGRATAMEIAIISTFLKDDAAIVLPLTRDAIAGNRWVSGHEFRFTVGASSGALDHYLVASYRQEPLTAFRKALAEQHSTITNRVLPHLTP